MHQMTIQIPESMMPAPRGDAEGLAPHERSRVRAAALHARRVYPGWIGELVQRELTAYADFGYRFRTDALVPQLVAEVLAMPTPQPDDDPLDEAC
jgi:hypothetical protein